MTWIIWSIAMISVWLLILSLWICSKPENKEIEAICNTKLAFHERHNAHDGFYVAVPRISDNKELETILIPKEKAIKLLYEHLGLYYKETVDRGLVTKKET